MFETYVNLLQIQFGVGNRESQRLSKSFNLVVVIM